MAHNVQRKYEEKLNADELAIFLRRTNICYQNDLARRAHFLTALSQFILAVGVVNQLTISC